MIRWVDSVNTSGSHKLATRVEILKGDANPTGETALDVLAVDGGSVTLDATSSARGRFELTLAGTREAIPAAKVAALAPYGNEVRIGRGVETSPGNQDLVSLGIFRIDDTEIGEDGGDVTISISGLDRSGKFIDAQFEEPGQYAWGLNYAQLILDVLRPVGPFDYDFMTTTVTTPAFGPSVTWDTGQSRWEEAQTAADTIGGELFFDRNGKLILRPIPTAYQSAGGPGSADRFTEGENGVLLNLTRTLSRTDVYNRVIVTGAAPASGDPPRGVRTDDNPLSPTFYYGRFGPKPYFYDADKAPTQAQCEDIAQGILNRTLGAPDGISFGAVVNPARSPGDIVRLVRQKLAVDEDHIIDSVTIPLDAGSPMTAETRVTQLLS